MRSTSKLFAVAVSAALMSLWTTAACSSNFTERTIEPDDCSHCDANCVLDDGRTVLIFTKAVSEPDPKHERPGESRDRGDDGGQCGVFRLPWMKEQQPVRGTVPIRFSGNAAPEFGVRIAP